MAKNKIDETSTTPLTIVPPPLTRQEEINVQVENLHKKMDKVHLDLARWTGETQGAEEITHGRLADLQKEVEELKEGMSIVAENAVKVSDAAKAAADDVAALREYANAMRNRVQTAKDATVAAGYGVAAAVLVGTTSLWAVDHWVPRQ